MRTRTLGIALLGIALVVAACGDDDDAGDAETTTSSANGAATTVASEDSGTVRYREAGDSIHCYYRSDELIGPSGRDDFEELFSIVPESAGGPALSLYRVTDGSDPLDYSRADPEFVPNYVVGFTPGWMFAPGSDAVAASEPASLTVPIGNGGTDVAIGVVDTGFDPSTASPLTGTVTVQAPSPTVFTSSSGVVHATVGPATEVRSGRVGGHGTFVVHELLRTVPEAAITVLPAPFRDAQDESFTVPNPSATVSGASFASTMSTISDDARLATAIDNTFTRTPASILNLSLGTYGCADVDAPSGVPPAIRAALLKLKAEADDTRRPFVVVASAGNDDVDLPFYPAAFSADSAFQEDGVCPSADGTAELSCWLLAVGDPEPYSNGGSWVSALAVGSNVVSYRSAVDAVPEGWFAWSGTSFAAPCVTALIAGSADVATEAATLAGRSDLDCNISA